MSTTYSVYINIQGKTEDVNEFWDKHCQGGFYQSFLPEFDSWPFESEYRHDDNEIRIKFIQGSRSRPLDAFEEIMKMYGNSDLTISVFIDFESAAYWILENKEHNRDKFTPNVTSKSAEILDFLDKKYDLIPTFGNVATLEDDGSNEWKQLIAYRNIFKLKKEYPCDTLLSNMNLNYSGNKTIDKAKTIDFAKDIIDKYEPENLVFRINSKSESEELVKILKDSYETVKITKPPMLRKRSSARYVVCLKAKWSDESISIQKYQSFDYKHYLD